MAGPVVGSMRILPTSQKSPPTNSAMSSVSAIQPIPPPPCMPTHILMVVAHQFVRMILLDYNRFIQARRLRHHLTALTRYPRQAYLLGQEQVAVVSASLLLRVPAPGQQSVTRAGSPSPPVPTAPVMVQAPSRSQPTLPL